MTTLHVRVCDEVCSRNSLSHTQTHTYTLIQAWFCADRYCGRMGACSGFVEILSGSEEDLLDATSNIGPIR